MSAHLDACVALIDAALAQGDGPRAGDLVIAALTGDPVAPTPSLPRDDT